MDTSRIYRILLPCTNNKRPATRGPQPYAKKKGKNSLPQRDRQYDRDDIEHHGYIGEIVEGVGLLVGDGYGGEEDGSKRTSRPASSR